MLNSEMSGNILETVCIGYKLATKINLYLLAMKIIQNNTIIRQKISLECVTDIPSAYFCLELATRPHRSHECQQVLYGQIHLDILWVSRHRQTSGSQAQN